MRPVHDRKVVDPLRPFFHKVLREARVGAKIADAGVDHRYRRVAEVRRTRRRAVRRGQRRIEVDHVEGVPESGLVDPVRPEVADKRRHESVGAPFGVAATVVRVQPADALPFLFVAVEVVTGVEGVAIVEAVIELHERLALPLRRRKRAWRQHRRHYRHVVDIGVFVIGEVVGDVAFDRAADGSAELAPSLRGPGTREQVCRHKIGWPPEAISAAGERIGAALRHNADRAGAGLTGLGLEPVGNDLQLLDHVERQAVAAAEFAVERADLAPGHRHAVGDEVRHPDALAVHRQRSAAGARRDDAAGCLQEREKVAAVGRQRVDLAGIEN